MSELRFPLEWPAQWPRTTPEQRRADNFKVTFAVARDELLHELRLLKASDFVISSNIPLRQDGFPMAKAGRPEDPGVAVYFTRRGKRLCVPCDSWTEPRANMRAVGLAIGAIRGLERWGAGGMVSAAFSGFEALPAKSSESAYFWWDVLGFHSMPEDEAQLRSQYRVLAKQYHPDAGGDHEFWLKIQAAYDEGMAYLNG